MKDKREVEKEIIERAVRNRIANRGVLSKVRKMQIKGEEQTRNNTA